MKMAFSLSFSQTNNPLKKKISSIFLVAILFLTSIGHSSDEISYSQENAKKYAKFGIEGTSWLSFRDIPFYVKKYVKGKKTLDLGCGAGRSTRFLTALGLDVVGVDISEQYLKEAVFIDPKTHFFLSEKGKIPSIENSYDFVFSSFVLIMIPTKEELKNTVKEVCRILKKEGIFIVITGSEEMHSIDKKWLSYETSFPENKNPKSGDRLKVMIKKVGAIFYDYNWLEDDYSKLFTSNGFEILETHHPLGKDNEGYAWSSEKECSPYIVYVLKKK